jgi:hypothetical protein
MHRSQAYVHAPCRGSKLPMPPMTGKSNVCLSGLLSAPSLPSTSDVLPTGRSRAPVAGGELCCGTCPSRILEIEQGLVGGTQASIRCLGRKRVWARLVRAEAHLQHGAYVGAEERGRRKGKWGRKKGVAPALLPLPTSSSSNSSSAPHSCQ